MKIVYTLTDEAPALATASLLPILRAFTAAADIEIEVRDISLAGRILAQFPDRLDEEQRVADALAELGELATQPEGNIIKLPNISASVPQLKAAIEELQDKGYAIPDYPEEPQDDEQRDTRARYDQVKGSAVNPVLRQGNSDRRAPPSVKEYARQHPHSMGDWSSDSKSHVSSMTQDDFRATERSHTVERGGTLKVEHVDPDGDATVLKEAVEVQDGEIIDAALMRRAALEAFLGDQIADAKERGVLFSVHLKTTMMRVSDPIIFGYVVRAYFKDLFEQHGDALKSAGVNANDGLRALLKAVESLPEDERGAINRAVDDAYEDGPPLAMVDSDRGITNLHVPSDVIIDASMPAAIRSSGQMWNAQGEQQDAKFVIPDHSYAALYGEAVEHCRRHGAFDPAKMGSTPNVGLMAQAAEEYGSHDKTFEIERPGTVRVVDEQDETLLEHEVDTGDIWRMCQTKDAPIQDWIRLAVTRARETDTPAIFWLDETRAHDAEVLRKVNSAFEDLDTEGLDIAILDVTEAARRTLERARAEQDTIAVTGNVLRDYLTDLFPILELGTSAKMLSIVPLMQGGGLFETGAGGSAPRHVQQFVKENHLRWDSLGEFLALGPSLELLATKDDKPRARLLAQTLDRAIGRHLEEDRSPRRKVGELDNRGSHFYLALYWARELAEQGEDAELADRFAPLAEKLAENEEKIVDELGSVQGSSVDIDGYYRPDIDKVAAAMRPSKTFNDALELL
ncbi:MAG: NADP-dependent isocitrate dehydrogenase [Solirubrobacterales bacterium]|nr:NADP-dependent isocitrate dehydrogenase [Solirubrobacterales bacterium]MBV9807552.1 NADP-dependent isocitrate dehydrogenase [Solirubrobacterales bacterium]